MSEGKSDKSLSCAKVTGGKQMCFYGSCYENKVIGDPDFKQDMKWKISLADPNVAVATDEQGHKHKGTWTTVYDEGFEVDVKGRKFFAFSHFANGGSQCDKTHPGWHRDSENPDAALWGCYSGQKESEELAEEHVAELTEEERLAHESLSMVQIEVTEKVPEDQIKAYKQPDPARDVQYQPEHDLVARINAKPGVTWKAKVYPEWEKYTVAEFNQLAGFRPAQLPADTRPRPPAKASGMGAVPRLPNDVFLEEEVSHLPEELDWRNKDGQDYVDAVISQSCGSCFAVSTTSMINSRIRIMTKNRVKPNIPYKQVLSCDRYNQACAGGYPYLVEKYAQDFGLTSSGKCAKSKSELKELGESDSDNEATYRVTKFGYIGGYYGGSRTAQMMQEIYDNGPIVVGINGGFELMHYESGLFIETGEGESGVRNDFERVDHAVMVVGWAKNPGGKGKHWIVKNSYGAGWGEHGYFKMALGGDTHGITSLTSAAIPVVGDSDYFNEQDAQPAETGTDAGKDGNSGASLREQSAGNRLKQVVQDLVKKPTAPNHRRWWKDDKQTVLAEAKEKESGMPAPDFSGA